MHFSQKYQLVEQDFISSVMSIRDEEDLVQILCFKNIAVNDKYTNCICYDVMMLAFSVS